MPVLRLALAFILLVLGLSLSTFAQGTYTLIAYPQSGTATYPYGINSSGEVVGFWGPDKLGNYEGFLLSNATYTAIVSPSGFETSLNGINDNGQLVGYDGLHGFIYDVNGQTFTNIDYPGASNTYATAINNAGNVVGYFCPTAGLSSGFLLVGSIFTKIAPPNSSDIRLGGISNAGVVVGYAFSNRTDRFSFFSLKKNYRTINIPGAPGALVFGINPQGNAIVGDYNYDGFLYQNGQLQTLHVPGSMVTCASGINSLGQVVGYYENLTGSCCSGFLWTPPANVASR